MKDEWYSDKRDLVKWSGIIRLCEHKNIKTVIQVAYYRKSNFPPIVFDEYIPKDDLHPQVKKHFRDIRDIQRLGTRTKIKVEVIDDQIDDAFNDASRAKYINKVCCKMKGSRENKIVFLDPDTGLEPKICEAAHVKKQEVKAIWDYLNRGDILVFYQHSFREPDCFETRRREFATACHEEPKRVHYWSSEIAYDVRCFYIEKTR